MSVAVRDFVPRNAVAAELSADSFDALSAPHRHELLVHCYRMLGSIDDAEDAVQEAMTRAWRGRKTYRADISFRAWLYRIATNVCLDLIAQRNAVSRGAEPFAVLPVPAELVAEAASGPEARYDEREAVSLAFLTALQLLTPRQRGVLILRDVLGWRAAEVAELLDLSLPAANSALHRARAVLVRRYAPTPIAAPKSRKSDTGRLRAVLARYVRAWEEADVAGLVALLREDAIVSMPPDLIITGAQAIATFLADSVFAGRQIRLWPVNANGGPAHVLYSGKPADRFLGRYCVIVLDLVEGAGSITTMGVYTESATIARFGSPTRLEVVRA